MIVLGSAGVRYLRDYQTAHPLRMLVGRRPRSLRAMLCARLACVIVRRQWVFWQHWFSVDYDSKRASNPA